MTSTNAAQAGERVTPLPSALRSPDGYLVLDEDGRILRASRTFAAAVAISGPPLAGRRLVELMPPDERDAFQAWLATATDRVGRSRTIHLNGPAESSRAVVATVRRARPREENRLVVLQRLSGVATPDTRSETGRDDRAGRREGVIVVSDEGVVTYASPAACAAIGAPQDQLVGAELVRRVDVVAEPGRARNGRMRGEHAQLSRRETEIVRLLADGLDVQTCAVRMGISVHTARYYVKSMMRKLRARTQLQAVVNAARLGYVDLS